MDGKCSEERRFFNIESEIKELKETVKNHGSEISELKTDQAEAKLYVKQILEKIEDLKALFKVGSSESTKAISENNKTWQAVIIEALKTIGIVGGIIAGIKLL